MNADDELNKGKLHLEEKRPNEARERFLRVLKVDPLNAEAYFGLARTDTLEGNLDDAISNFRKALELEPHPNISGFFPLCSDPTLASKGKDYEHAGTYLLLRGYVDEAEFYYKLSIECNAEDYIPYFYLGLLSEVKHDEDQALESYQKVADLCYKNKTEFHDGCFTSYCQLGNILVTKGDLNKAQLCFEIAITLRQDFSHPYIGLGNIWDRRENEEKAIDFYKKAISIDPESAEAYSNLGYQDIGLNPDKSRHLYRSFFLAEIQKKYNLIGRNIRYLLDADVPMLLQRLASVLPLSEIENYTFYNQALQESIEKTRFFRQLITVWRQTTRFPEKSLLAEAIINYCLGDPIRAYNIFNDELDRDDVNINLCGQYYFCLSAHAIMEEEQQIINYAVRQADEVIGSIDPEDYHEMYYAALIYNLAGEYERSITIFQSLFPSFIPAGYKLLEIYNALSKAESSTNNNNMNGETPSRYLDERSKILSALRLEEGCNPVYRFGIVPLQVDHNEEKFLGDIMHILHFTEIEESLCEVFEKPFEIKNSFLNNIKLADEDYKNETASLKHKAEKAWQQMLEQELNPAEIDDNVHGFSQFKHPVSKLGQFIEYGAKAELFDALENHQRPARFNFKLYLSVVYRLYKENVLNQEEALSITDYIYTCMDNLPAFAEDQAKNLLLNSVKDYFLEENIPYIGYVQKLSRLVKLIQESKAGKKGKIIDFEEFLSIHRLSQTA